MGGSGVDIEQLDGLAARPRHFDRRSRPEDRLDGAALWPLAPVDVAIARHDEGAFEELASPPGIGDHTFRRLFRLEVLEGRIAVAVDQLEAQAGNRGTLGFEAFRDPTGPKAGDPGERSLLCRPEFCALMVQRTAHDHALIARRQRADQSLDRGGVDPGVDDHRLSSPAPPPGFSTERLAVQEPDRSTCSDMESMT